MSQSSIKRLLDIFFFNDTATTEIYTLSLHDALPICVLAPRADTRGAAGKGAAERDYDVEARFDTDSICSRSEEHTSELQSQSNIVCRLLLEKKKKTSFTF